MGTEVSRIIHDPSLKDPVRPGISEFQRAELIWCKSNSKVMTCEDFCRVLCLPPNLTNPIFAYFDLDGDKSVDDFEFITTLVHLTCTDIAKRLSALFTIYDTENKETIAVAQFDALIESLLRACVASPRVSEIPQKLAKLKAENYLNEPYVTGDQFGKIALADPDLLAALADIGILSPKFESKEAPIDDLEVELRKFYLDSNNWSDMSVTDNGLDRRSEIDTGILDTLMQKAAIADTTKPFERELGMSKPEYFSMEKPGLEEAPNASIKPEYIYGYRGFDIRNNLFSNSKGHLVYHAAKAGIILDTDLNVQRFSLQHTEAVSCLDVFGDLAVTGELGSRPVLCFWDCVSAELSAVLAGVIKEGIAMARFAQNGKRLIVSTVGENRWIYILDIEKVMQGARKEGKIAGPKEPILDLRATPDDDSVVLTTKQNIYFLEKGVAEYKIKPISGWGPKTSPIQPTLSIGFVDYDAVVGTIKGDLLRLKGSHLTERISAHEGPVYAICTLDNNLGIITGGQDGKVLFWDNKLTNVRSFDLSSLAKGSVHNPAIRAITDIPSKKSIAVGTRSGEILQIFTNGQMQIVMNSHAEKEVWGLAAYPDGSKMLTCGDDYSLMIWDTHIRKLKQKKKIPYRALCCDISAHSAQTGKTYLAVGCTNGYLLIFDAETLALLHSIKSRSREITKVQFSPDASILASGGMDHNILLYPTKDFKLKATLEGLKGGVTNLDFTADSKCIRATSSLFELLHWDLGSCKSITNGASLLKNEKWHSQHACYGWAVQGLWTESSHYDEVSALCRSPNQQFIAAGDDLGTIKLLKYPSVIKNANYNAFNVHSGIVSGILITDRKLFSIGATDKSLIQWKIKHQKEEVAKAADLGGFEDADLNIAKEFNTRKDPDTRAISKMYQLCAIDAVKQLFKVEGLELEDNKMEGKPFVPDAKKSIPSTVVIPGKPLDPPEGNLFIKHVFGFRCHDCKDFAKFLADPDKILYPCGTLGVTMNITTNQQSFYVGHEDDLVGIDSSGDDSLSVTSCISQDPSALKPDYIIWNNLTHEEITKVQGIHYGNVQIVRFSPNKNVMMSIARDPDNTIAIVDWSNSRLIATAKCSRKGVYDADWCTPTQLVTMGKDHIKFWKLKMNSLTASHGIWGDHTPEPLVSVKYYKKLCLTGSGSGNIYIWENYTAISKTKAHIGTLFCLTRNHKTGKILTGGKDGLVKSWDLDLEKKELRGERVFFSYEQICKRPEFKAIRSIDTHPSDGRVLIGTRSCEMILLDQNGALVKTVLQGHFEGEICGLGVHSVDPLFVTSCEDKTIKIWHLIARTIKASLSVKTAVRALDWSPDGKYIAAGNDKAELRIYDPDLQELAFGLSEFAASGGRIAEVRFDPKSELVSIGAIRGAPAVEIVGLKRATLPDGSEKLSLMKLAFIPTMSIGGVMRMDWSIDSIYIAANTDHGELKFVNYIRNSVLDPGSIKDVPWATWTCPLGYSTLGVFPHAPGFDVDAVCRSNSEAVIATGDQFEVVNLFQNPALLEKSGCKKYLGHSTGIKRLRFCVNDNCLVSVSGKDQTIIVWETDFGSTNVHKRAFLTKVSDLGQK